MDRADWYPDPTHRFEFRYHNGERWTGDVSIDGNRFLDPLQGSPAPARPPGKGISRAAFVLGLSSVLVGWLPFVCVLAIAAAILAVIFAVSAIRRQRATTPPGPPPTLAVAGLILAPLGLVASGIGIWLSVLTIRELNEYTNVGAYHLATTSCVVNDGTAIANGTITNESASTKHYHLVVEFMHPGSDDALYTESAEVDSVAPGETAEWTTFTAVDEEQLDCRVRSVSGPLPFDDF